MTVSQDMYPGTRLDRKNIPPPLSLASFNYPGLQQHINIPSPHNTVPKSAPPQPTNNDLMQFQLQLMLQSANESKTPGPTLQSQFSTPASLQSQFSTPAALQSLQNQFSGTPPNLQSQMSTPGGLQSQFSTPGGLQSQFSTPGNIQSQFSTPPSMPSQYGSNLQLYNSPMSPMLPMSLDSPGMQQQQQQQQPQDGKNNASRYKTELCRPYEENGSCKYGEKCQFAHGIHELRNLSRHPKYKTELCRTFHTIGFCPYGPRCHFIHNTEEKRAPPISPGPHNSGSNATLQNIPALLSLFQQSTNVNKVMTFLSKMQLQLGAKSTDEVLQYLNINSANLMTPPSTPNMFSFPEYMVPAAQALNQATRPAPGSSAATANSNIHSYFNFNLALKDQHLSGLLSAAQLHNPAHNPAQLHNPMLYPALHSPAGTPPLQMPCLSAGTPPMSSSEGSPMSERSADLYSAQHLRYETCYQDNPAKLHHGYHDNPAKLHGYHGDLSAEYMVPGRVINEEHAANGKRLPIFNQLSEVC